MSAITERCSASTSIRRGFAGAALACCTLIVAACHDLLDVTPPNQVPVSAVTTPDQAPLLVSGAVADFECAVAGYTVIGGLVTDELAESGATVARFNLDRRATNNQDPYGTQSCGNGALLGAYTPLSVARYSADHAVTVLTALSATQVPGRDTLIATANAYAGYSLVMLGEGFCSAAIDGGPELTPTLVLKEAEARFTASLASATTPASANIRLMALVGRARARLDLASRSVAGAAAGALADAQLIPIDFVKNATYSIASSRRENYVFDDNVSNRRSNVDAPYRNVAFAGVPDPRVPVQVTSDASADGTTPRYLQLKYTDKDSPIPLATGAEALLIAAELQGGQTAVDAINTLHDLAGLPHFASSDAAEIRAQVVRERMAQLFLDSHRLGDVIRLSIALSPAAGTPYPKGGAYGNQICLPLPAIEKDNNTHIGS